MRRLPSGRWQASYVGPDLALHSAPYTFDSALDAEGWLAGERRLLASDEPLRPRTLQLYRGLLERIIYPVFRDLAPRKVTLEDVEAWWDALPADTPTQNAPSYALLRSLFAEAAKAGERPHTGVRANPLRGQGRWRVAPTA